MEVPLTQHVLALSSLSFDVLGFDGGRFVWVIATMLDQSTRRGSLGYENYELPVVPSDWAGRSR